MLYKNTLIKIKKSLGRYISLMILIMVGVGFYSGVSISAPAITGAADRYFNTHKLMDFKIVSTAGLTDADAAALQMIDGVSEVIPSYSLDVLSDSGAIRLHAIEDRVNTVSLLEGRMPEEDGECLADSEKFVIGDTIIITGGTPGGILYDEFTVTGLIDSVLYLNDDYGGTSVGNGSLTSFVFIPKDAFSFDAYTEIYLIADTGGAEAYSDDYNASVKKTDDEIIRIKPERENARLEELYDIAAKKAAELAASMSGGFAGDYAGDFAEDFAGDYAGDFAEGLPVQDMESPKWYISGRSAASGYDVLGNSIKVVAIVAAVLPLFFIIISMLMTSNSMARMIAEERGELGTLASLGYKNTSIILTYMLYALSASWLGTIAGFEIGCNFIPPLIYQNFTVRMPPLLREYSAAGFTVILAVVSALVIFVTVMVCKRELGQKPAYLMRPLPPRRGQRIFVERAGFIWRRLSFTWKVTLRNMLRYKKRAVMTVIGVSGCTALLVTAFGIRDGMSGVAQKQYGDILQYDVMLILNGTETELIPEVSAETVTDAYESGKLYELLVREQLKKPLLIEHSAFKCEQDGILLDCYIIVPQDTGLFERYYRLKSTRTKSEIDLDSGGIIITQRIARVYNLKKGDTLSVLDAENNVTVLTVSDIAENYTSNYIYLKPGVYKEVFGAEPEYNAVVAEYGGDETGLQERLIESGLIISAVFTSDARQSVYDSTQNLNGVILLVILVASMLTVVVLYNLTAINISERTREIATLKVLGFRDGEANAYIYREAAVLTVISIVLGLFLGVLLHRYVAEVIEEGVLSITLAIKPVSFALSAGITALFSALMQVVTYFKLKSIDMLQSLKSVE